MVSANNPRSSSCVSCPLNTTILYPDPQPYPPLNLSPPIYISTIPPLSSPPCLYYIPTSGFLRSLKHLPRVYHPGGHTKPPPPHPVSGASGQGHSGKNPSSMDLTEAHDHNPSSSNDRSLLTDLPNSPGNYPSQPSCTCPTCSIGGIFNH